MGSADVTCGVVSVVVEQEWPCRERMRQLTEAVSPLLMRKADEAGYPLEGRVIGNLHPQDNWRSSVGDDLRAATDAELQRVGGGVVVVFVCGMAA